MKTLQKNDYKIIKETEKAYLLEIENNSYWFPKSKLKIENDIIEIEDSIFEKAEAIDKKTAFTKILCKSELYKKDNEEEAKSYKITININSGSYKAEKFIFVPIKFVSEQNTEFIICETWNFDKSLQSLLDAEVEYFNGLGEEKKTTNDYEIEEEIIEM